MPIRPIEIMEKHTYDPDKDGIIALAQLVAAVCSETEADNKITTHKGDASAHHTKYTNAEADARIAIHAAIAAAHHTKTTSAAEITSGQMNKERLQFTANKLLKGAGAGNPPTEIDVPSAGLADAAVGDLLGASSDSEVIKASQTTYTKVKEIRLARTGAYRIKFDLAENVAGAHAYGRVYKNGVAFGTEQTVAHSTTYVTKSEDISGWSAGDLCQLYIKNTNSAKGSKTQNFRIYVSQPIDNIVVT